MNPAIIAGLSLLATLALAESRPNPPLGWRYPTEAEISQDWRSASAERYAVVVADFDGDLRPDRAMLLVRKSDGKAALVVTLGRAPGKAMVLELLEDVGWLEVMGIDVAEAGKYDTACGQGFYDCEKGEPEVISLKRPAIDFFKWESANSFFYYDPRVKSFRRVWISD